MRPIRGSRDGTRHDGSRDAGSWDDIDPGFAPATQRALRRRNLGVVLRQVADNGPRSRATIALETGFNKSTVSSLVGGGATLQSTH